MEVVTLLCSVAFLFTVYVASEQEQLKHTVSMTIDEDRFLQLLSRVENLEKRDQEQQEDIHMLRSELNAEKNRSSLLEAKLSWLLQELAQPDDVEKRTTEKGSHDQDADTINTNENVSDTLSGKIAGLHSSRIRRQEQMPVIAFHATLSSLQLHTGVHQTIVFDHAITNIGGAYKPHFGSFVAPVPGVYVFSTTILHHGSLDAHCSIVRNTASVANLYMRDDKAIYDSSSATIVLHLNKGDDVAVQNNDADKQIEGSSFSMFSGFLLQEDQPDVAIVGK